MTADNQSKDTEENAVDNKESSTSAEQQKEPVQGPGDILRKAREAKNLSQREVADRLRLRLQIIELLEADQYDSFSTPTFIKGYLRAYAKVLGVNDQEVFAAYKKLGIKEPDTTAMQSFSRRVKHQESDNRLMLITYAVIIVVISLVIWWWQDSDISFSELNNDVQQAVEEQQPQQVEASPDGEQPLLESEAQASETNTSLTATEGDPQSPPEDAEAVTVSGTEQPETVLESVNQPSPAATDGTSATSESQPQTVINDTEGASELNEVNQPAPGAEAEQSNMAAAEGEVSNAADSASSSVSDEVVADLVFKFSEECWVKVEDAAGETQAVGIKAAGYTMEVPGDAPFSVTICKPEAVTLTYQGEAVDLSSFRQARVARFTVPLSN